MFKIYIHWLLPTRSPTPSTLSSTRIYTWIQFHRLLLRIHVSNATCIHIFHTSKYLRCEYEFSHSHFYFFKMIFHFLSIFLRTFYQFILFIFKIFFFILFNFFIFIFIIIVSFFLFYLFISLGKLHLIFISASVVFIKYTRCSVILFINKTRLIFFFIFNTHKWVGKGKLKFIFSSAYNSVQKIFYYVKQKIVLTKI